MKISFNVEPKELIFGAVVAGVDRIMERRALGHFHALESKISVDIGRQNGHSTAAAMLFEKYTAEGWTVYIVSRTVGIANNVRDIGLRNGIKISKRNAMSLRRFLNPCTWHGHSLRNHMFILDTTMSGMTESVEKFYTGNAMRCTGVKEEEFPIFIGLGMN